MRLLTTMTRYELMNEVKRLRLEVQDKAEIIEAYVRLVRKLPEHIEIYDKTHELIMELE